MSLILEALRKSEAERRRGQTPDLLSEALPAPAAVHRPQANWALVGAVATAAALTFLVVAWWLRSPADAPSAAADVMDPAPDARPSRDVEATAAEPDPQPLQPPPRSQPSLSPPVAASRAPAPIEAASQSASSAAATVPPATTAAAPAPMGAMPATTPPPRTTTVPPAPVKPEPALPTPQQVAALDTAPPARAGTPAFASPDLPVKLSDLSSEDRQQLPTLKVSMHMWAPDAGSRFAIIDGTRVNEGDRVGEATVDAILQDGVMLSWHGRQIRLPIR